MPALIKRLRIVSEAIWWIVGLVGLLHLGEKDKIHDSQCTRSPRIAHIYSVARINNMVKKQIIWLNETFIKRFKLLWHLIRFWAFAVRFWPGVIIVYCGFWEVFGSRFQNKEKKPEKRPTNQFGSFFIKSDKYLSFVSTFSKYNVLFWYRRIQRVDIVFKKY